MPTPPTTALDNTDEHSTTALFRAAIGEVNSAYYLPMFERFEAADRAGLSWNGPAALYTLNWLAFRQLWHAALLYSGALVALVLGIFGIGRLVFGLPETTQWALLGSLALLSILVPGLGANALLYRATRKRMEAALQATQTVAEACTWLNRRAPTRKSLIIQMVCNVLAIGLLAYGWMQFEGWSAAPAAALQATTDARNVAVGRTTESTPAAATASAPAAATSAPVALPAASAPTTAASASAPPSAPALAASAPASTPASPAAAAPAALPASAPANVASAPVVVPPPAKTTAPAQQPPTPAAASKATSAKAPGVAPPKSEPAKPRKSEAAPPAPRATASAPQKIILLSKPVALESAKPGAANAGAAPTDTEPTTTKATRYLVNIGQLLQENSSRNALALLTDAELPVTAQVVRTAQGQRTRIRVGPFDSLAEAERAADKARSLGLEAQVAPQ